MPKLKAGLDLKRTWLQPKEPAANPAAHGSPNPLTYRQNGVDTGALDAPDFVPAGSTRSYVSSWSGIPVVDGFVLR